MQKKLKNGDTNLNLNRALKLIDQDRFLGGEEHRIESLNSPSHVYRLKGFNDYSKTLKSFSELLVEKSSCF